MATTCSGLSLLAVHGPPRPPRPSAFFVALPANVGASSTTSGASGKIVQSQVLVVVSQNGADFSDLVGVASGDQQSEHLPGKGNGTLPSSSFFNGVAEQFLCRPKGQPTFTLETPAQAAVSGTTSALNDFGRDAVAQFAAPATALSQSSQLIILIHRNRGDSAFGSSAISRTNALHSGKIPILWLASASRADFRPIQIKGATQRNGGQLGAVPCRWICLRIERNQNAFHQQFFRLDHLHHTVRTGEPAPRRSRTGLDFSQ